MTTNHAWREQLLDLIADTRKQLALPAVADDTTPDKALLVEFLVDDVRFDLLHTNGGPASGAGFLLQCHFGEVRPDAPEKVLADVMTKNWSLARVQLGHYGLDEDGKVLVFNLLQPMAGLTGVQLAEAMTDISAVARQWRADHPTTVQ